MTLHRFLCLTTIAAFLLVIAGGLVTSTDSGLSVPDWPLSYGMVFPPMVGGILYEHSHRLIAAAVGLLTLIAVVWLWMAERRRWVRWLGYAALLGVIAQGILGGLTVLLLLPPPVSIAHACLGPFVFCLVVCVTWATSPAWPEHPHRFEDSRRPMMRVLGAAVALLAMAQLFLGAVIRHTGAGVAAHVAGALSLVVTAAWFAGRAARVRQRAPLVWADARRLLSLIALQLIIGLLVLIHRRALGFRTAHMGLGALVLAQAIVLAWNTARLTTSARHFLCLEKCQALFELTKPRLTTLVLMTTAAGFWLGLRSGEGIARLWPTLVGTGLIAGGANALNQWLERVPDGLMHRTKHRPLPAGRLPPQRAHHFGFVLLLLGTIVLAFAVNALSAALALLSAASYVMGYTPMKQATALSTLIGAIPGALPPVVGWAAARNALGVEAGVLFTILFMWQLPHFLAIGWLYRDDYARAAFQLLPVVDPGGGSTVRQIVWYSTALVPVSLLPTMTGLAGHVYFFGALALGLGFLGVSLRAAVRQSSTAARQLFVSSISYLPALLLLMAVDKVSR